MLHLKIHPRLCVWLHDKTLYNFTYLNGNPFTDSMKIIDSIKKAPQPVTGIIIEKPFLCLSGNVKNTLLVRDICTILQWHFPSHELIDSITARQGIIYGKEQQITEAQALTQNHDHSPIELLCIHDCLVLKKYHDGR